MVTSKFSCGFEWRISSGAVEPLVEGHFVFNVNDFVVVADNVFENVSMSSERRRGTPRATVLRALGGSAVS